MPFTTKTEAEVLELVRAHLRNRIPEADLSSGSDYDLLSRMVAAIYVGNQEGTRYLLRQVFPSTAEGAYLELHAELRGLAREIAEAAIGLTILTGPVPLITQPAGSTLTHGSGAAYTTDALAQTALSAATGKTCSFDCSRDRVFVMPDLSNMLVGEVFTIDGNTVAIRSILSAAGAVEVYPRLPSAPADGVAITAAAGALANVTAALAGAAGNRDAGDTITVDAPGVYGAYTMDATCVVAELTGGGDEETDTELRERIRAFMSLRPASGNVAHFRAWSRETGSVRLSDAFVYPNYRGLSAVDVVPMGIAGARQTGDSTNALVTTKLVAEASFSDDVLVRQLTLSSTPTDVALTLTPLTDFEPDFIGVYTEDAGNSTGDVLRLMATAVGVVKPGDRVLVPVTINGFDRLRQYEAVLTASSGGLHWIQLATTLEGPIVASASITSGGPLAQDTIDAVDAVFDSLGPGDTSPSTRHPGPSEAWEPALRISRLIAAVQGLAGMDTLAVTAPAVDVIPNTFERVVLGQLSITHA